MHLWQLLSTVGPIYQPKLSSHFGWLVASAVPCTSAMTSPPPKPVGSSPTPRLTYPQSQLVRSTHPLHRSPHSTCCPRRAAFASAATGICPGWTWSVPFPCVHSPWWLCVSSHLSANGRACFVCVCRMFGLVSLTLSTISQRRQRCECVQRGWPPDNSIDISCTEQHTNAGDELITTHAEIWEYNYSAHNQPVEQ